MKGGWKMTRRGIVVREGREEKERGTRARVCRKFLISFSSGIQAFEIRLIFSLRHFRSGGSFISGKRK